MTTLPLFSLIKELLIAIARAYPALVTLLVLSNVINDYNNTVLLLLSEFLNPFLKDISRALMGDKTYPILGNGNRPSGAMNCGLYANGKKATSYGMPSGHAQIAVTFAAYIILTLHQHIQHVLCHVHQNHQVKTVFHL
jgi:membrane-associated phospholipid phosphatase